MDEQTCVLLVQEARVADSIFLPFDLQEHMVFMYL